MLSSLARLKISSPSWRGRRGVDETTSQPSLTLEEGGVGKLPEHFTAQVVEIRGLVQAVTLSRRHDGVEKNEEEEQEQEDEEKEQEKTP